jgi:putative addiction module component (TIGR02574 family)
MEDATVVPSLAVATSRDQIFREALELEQGDRAELAKILIDSLDPAAAAEVEEEWMREIDRRAAELDSGSVRSIPWDAVRSRLRRSGGG